jgi:hypothetical protein
MNFEYLATAIGQEVCCGYPGIDRHIETVRDNVFVPDPIVSAISVRVVAETCHCLHARHHPAAQTL